jgi:hypothetical protein
MGGEVAQLFGVDGGGVEGVGAPTLPLWGEQRGGSDARMAPI